ncbi:MAG: hypothetical protein M0R32_02460 [Candidatus Cloacimonetes bacterium]|jgi:transcription initiation factor TFIIIB Brf1 subunit/transcription initiation factor TFIIB|nr:hypothetical protein [Candidatus Cloacimonadota bacterium]
MKKNERILASITDAGAKRISKKYNLPVSQVEQAFNVYDNCVESGEIETMSVSRMGALFRQCVWNSTQVDNGMVWNDLAREFRDNYDELRRKRW